MKKMTKLMLMLTMLFGMVGGVSSVKAGKLNADLSKLVDGPVSTWNAETNTMTWTGTSNNMIGNFNFAAGDYKLYSKIVVNISALNNADGVRLQIRANGKEKIVILSGTGIHEKSLTADFEFSTADLENFEWARLLGTQWTDSHSGTWGETPAQAVISEVYLESHTRNLNVDLASLPVESENTTWEWNSGTSTGTFGWGGTSWNSTELFAAGNYSAYTTLNLVTETGTADHFRIIIKFTNGAGQVTISPVSTGTVSLTLTDYTTIENLAAVQTIRLSGANDVTGNITVSSIYLEGPDVTYIEATELFGAPAGTTDLNGMTGAGEIKWTVSYPKEMKPGEGWCGDIDRDNQSVDISSYDYLHFVVTEASADANLGVRVFVSEENLSDNTKRHCLYPHPIAKAAEVSDWEAFSPITSTGVYVVKISNYPLLRGFKGGNSWQDGNAGTALISQAYVSSGAPVDYVSTGKYALVGEAAGSVSLTAALADANATCYDATGVTGTSVDLTSVANPNALFIANDGALANTQNVIVGGTCANLVLTDKKPFKAPVDFTATSAAFSKTVSAADYATMVLPFNAKLPLGVEAYDITGNEGDVLTTSKVLSITANKPVMLKNAGTYEFTATNAAIKAVEGVQTNGLLNGVYATTDAPVDASYVLQNKSGDVNFYKAAAGTKVDAFRAYLTATAGARLTFDFNSETTDISATLNDKGEMRNDRVVYNLNGQRVEKATKGLYIKNGKKVVVR